VCDKQKYSQLSSDRECQIIWMTMAIGKTMICKVNNKLLCKGMSGNKQGYISCPIGLGDQYGKSVLHLN
jgi:hypothetical protein